MGVDQMRGDTPLPGPSAPGEAVVLVHGLWMRGPDMWVLRHRLRRAGFKTYQFSYPTTRCTLNAAADQLAAFLDTQVREARVHFVAHSLGGNVVFHFLHQHPFARAGRIVALGTPFQGSIVAARMAKSALGRFLLGKTHGDGLAAARRHWRVDAELGVIAGNGRVGLGRLIGGLAGEHDGTVTVAETRIPGAAAHCVLPVSHTQMLLSAAVAGVTEGFLRRGTFAN